MNRNRTTLCDRSGQRVARLAVVETHPIQYKAPLFRHLAGNPHIDLHVFYAMIPDPARQGAEFGVAFTWDVPLLSGYPYSVLTNVARDPSVTRFGGCNTPEIHRCLRDLRPDAVLVNGWVVKTCLQALWACKRLGIPCWVRGEANLLRPRAWWKHAIHRRLLRLYDGYLAIGRANRDFYRFHKCPPERIGWAPYAVENQRFTQAVAERSPARARIRAAWNIPEAAITFLFSGKLIEKKRPLDVLRALASLPPAAREQAHGLFVGDGPLRPALEAWAAQRHVPVTFAGFVNQSRIPDAYVAADVLTLPSDAGETWGLVVNEAMASGRPAIVSNRVGCAADLVTTGETGTLYECGAVDQLRDAMQNYVFVCDRAVREGGEARRRIAAYDVSVTAEGIAQAVLSFSRGSSRAGH